MYEAKQNKEKVSRRIDTGSIRHRINFENRQQLYVKNIHNNMSMVKKFTVQRIVLKNRNDMNSFFRSPLSLQNAMVLYLANKQYKNILKPDLCEKIFLKLYPTLSQITQGYIIYDFKALKKEIDKISHNITSSDKIVEKIKKAISESTLQLTDTSLKAELDYNIAYANFSNQGTYLKNKENDEGMESLEKFDEKGAPIMTYSGFKVEYKNEDLRLFYANYKYGKKKILNIRINTGTSHEIGSDNQRAFHEHITGGDAIEYTKNDGGTVITITAYGKKSDTAIKGSGGYCWNKKPK